MSKSFLLFTASIAFGLVLVGAGCDNQVQNNTDTRPAGGEEIDAGDNTADGVIGREIGRDNMIGDDAVADNTVDDKTIEENADVVVEVSGQNFSFSPSIITVKKGQTVKINFTSSQGFHDWRVDEFDAKTEQINAPGSSSVTFVADKAGEFEFYCSVGQHRQMGMIGKLIVEDNK